MYYCDNCKSRDTEVRETNFEFRINNENYFVKGNRRFCSNCNCLVYDSKLDNDILRKAFRKKEEVLGIEPEKLISLRKFYGLSQSEFSKIIGCAKKTLISYEKGTSIPNDIYLITIKTLMDNPEIIGLLIDSNKNRFDSEELSNITKKIESNNIVIRNENNELSEYNGYQEFSFDKLSAIIKFLSRDKILKTKLLKELFYIDFLYFKNHTVSITGSEYVKFQYGPVPKDYSRLLSYLEKDNSITSNIVYEGNYECHYIESNSSDKILNQELEEDEIEIVLKVKDYFKDYTVSEIVDYSHKEKAFTATKQNSFISYDYALDIKGII